MVNTDGRPTIACGATRPADIRNRFPAQDTALAERLAPMSGYDRQRLRDRLAHLRGYVQRAHEIRDADQAYWERLGCGQDTEEAEHSGYLDGFHHGLEAALDAIENGADLADRLPEAAF